MNISRKSILTGIERTMDLPITQEQIDAWEDGALIQDVMPNLTDDEREFFKTGITADEWEQAFGDEAPAVFGENE